ncbi:MAG TPA: pyridoxal phosphate-dependent aminotransferase [Saprospiraceae bacterium]|nr:pyridoxal phosphate-dependent aminotransferase [Saprospiraceae bacterium]HND88325.1 pyridoxal phosphate-dependent aminotransferase [Saprospiraceae bacterium]
MPSISHRGATAHSSPIRKLAPFADAAKKSGKKVYHLNIGQPDILTPHEGLNAMRQLQMDILAYSPSNGYASLREKMLPYYQRLGVDLSPDQVLITEGASEGVMFSFLAGLNPGDTVLTPEPLYANYLGFAGMTGVRIKPITTSIETGFALPDVEAFRKALTPDVKALVLCNPNNPTGAFYPEATLRMLADLVLEFDLYLIVDEVYREFCYRDDAPFFSALRLQGLEQHVVVLDSISKRYSACGARIGAVVTRNAALMSAIHRYAETRLSPPTLGQIFAEATLQVEGAYFDAVLEEYRHRREVLYARLRTLPGVRCYPPDGAFYVFAELPIDDADRFCRWLLEDFSYQGATVMLAPGTGFYATPGLGRREVRIAYVLNADDIHRAMDCLEQALITYRQEVMGGSAAV